MANDIFYDRWQIVVHGGIDGYSRKIMYLKASTNNKASTVFSSFLAAINEFGLPERFRCEKGTLHVMCCVLLCVSLCELRSKDHNEKKPFCAFSIDSVPVLLYCILKLPINNSINQGGENMDVAQYMLEHPDRGPGRPIMYSYVLYIE